MAKDKIEETTQQLAEFVGEWVRTPSTLLGLAAALVSGIYVASESAKHLSNPLVRWGIELLALILLVSAIVVGKKQFKQSRILKPDGTPELFYDRSQFILYLFCAVFFTACLLTDIALNLTNAFEISEVSKISLRPSMLEVELEEVNHKGEAEKSNKPFSRVIDSGTSEQAAKFNSEKGPVTDTMIAEVIGLASFEFDIGKRSNVDELVIDDVIIEVIDYDPQFRIKESKHLAGRSNESVLVYELAKKKEPLPWVFHPKYRVDINDKYEMKLIRFNPGLIFIRDNFTTRMSCKVESADEGLFTFKVLVLEHSGFGPKRHPKQITDKPLTFLFVKYLPRTLEKPKETLPPK